MRWFVGVGALVIAGLAVYVLTMGRPLDPSSATSGSKQQLQPRAQGRSSGTASADRRPAMDEIDEQSREAMRELLRRADEE